MSGLRNTFKILLLLTVLFLNAKELAAQQQSADIDRAQAARDICAGIAAKFANSPGAKISFESGRFRVDNATGTLTVFESAVPVAQIPGFTFTAYAICLDKLIEGFEKGRKREEAKAKLEAFSAGYELSEALNIGICVRSAAMGGFYIGDTQNDDNIPLRQQRLKELMLAISKSVNRRLTQLSNQSASVNFVQDLQFYSFYQDRPVPYFTSDRIQTTMDSFYDIVPNDPHEYASLGALVGRLKRTYLYGFSFSFILQSTQNGFDDRANRARTFLPASLNCLARTYGEDTNRLKGALVDLNISNVSEIPDFVAALSRGQQGQFLFDQAVASKLRQFLRSN
jgi:hypothetical protein